MQQPDLSHLSAGRRLLWEAYYRIKEANRIPDHFYEERNKDNDAQEEQEEESQSERGGPRQASRTLKRRENDYWQKYDEQISRGRPDRTWKLCSDPLCSRRRCRYVDFMHIPIVKIAPADERLFYRRHDLFFDALITRLFGENLDRKTKYAKEDIIQSFIYSPLIKGALGQFDVLRQEYGRNPGSETLAKTLTEVRYAIIFLVSMTRLNEPVPDVHVFFGGEEKDYPDDWKLKHLVMQFCAVAEAWRRYVLERGGKDWDFGSDEAVADLLSAILLNFHNRARRGFTKVKRYSVLRVNKQWEKWLDKYHLMRDKSEDESDTEDEDLEEGECIKGFGTGSVPWMSERMKEACGLYDEAEESDEGEDDEEECWTDGDGDD